MAARVRIVVMVVLITVAQVFTFACQRQASHASQAEDRSVEAQRPLPRHEQVKERQPMPVGGIQAIADSLVYPEKAKTAGVAGTLLLSVIVSNDGKVEQVTVLRAIGDGTSGCEEAAIAAVRAVAWQPGLRDGQPQRMSVTIPIQFKPAGQ